MNKTSFQIIFGFFLSFCIASAQNRNLDNHLTLQAAMGAAWDGSSKWYFDFISLGGNTTPLNPGVGFGLGVEIGPLVRWKGAMLFPSIEVCFGEETSRKNYSRGTIEAGFQRMPIILWAKIISETDVSPFLKFGLGAAKTDFREIASEERLVNIRFHKWHFAWALGGGLNYQLDKIIAVELFVDTWLSVNDIVALDSNGNDYGFYGTKGISLIGCRITYLIQ